jgi:hypothetical protein
MRSVVCLLAFSLLFCCAVSAQDSDTTKADAFLGYTYVRQTYKDGILPYNVPFNMNGGSGQFVLYPTSSIGIVAEVAGTAASNIGGNPASGAMFTYLFGPRVTLHRGRLHPYVQALFGEAHLSSGLNYYLLSTNASGGPANNSFAVAAGVGLDWTLTRHFAVRLAQIDYLMTRFYDPFGNRFIQNNARYSGGVAYRF